MTRLDDGTRAAAEGAPRWGGTRSPTAPSFLSNSQRSRQAILDCQFDQGRIQCTNENYLTNRVAPNKIGLNALKTAQRVFATRNQKYSIKTLQTLCSSPAGALETLAMGMGIHNIVNESKA